MDKQYLQACLACSKLITRHYSTSFSLGIRFFTPGLHAPIYAIYGFVRLADEIVDTFHDQDKKKLLEEFKEDTYQSIEKKLGLNPVLHAFQHVVNTYHIEKKLIDDFLYSMEMDLEKKSFSLEEYKKYIHGSAEVVGLMCLRVFTANNPSLFDELSPYAISLGSAYQKINFLRDTRADYQQLGRIYFPGVHFANFTPENKQKIEEDTWKDFQQGFEGIKKLPRESRLGVYLSYLYFKALLMKIKKLPPEALLEKRVRISNTKKLFLSMSGYIQYCLGRV
jgi:phytoene/squalene synthetase